MMAKLTWFGAGHEDVLRWNQPTYRHDWHEACAGSLVGGRGCVAGQKNSPRQARGKLAASSPLGLLAGLGAEVFAHGQMVLKFRQSLCGEILDGRRRGNYWLSYIPKQRLT